MKNSFEPIFFTPPDGSGHGLWKDSPSPPAAPDYAGAAKATAAGNRVNQVTPYGSQTYSQTDPTGNPDQYTQTVTLNPQVQQALDSQMGFSNQMGDVAQQALPRVQQSMQSGFDQSQVPGLQSNVSPLNPEIANQARDAAYSQATSRLDPQWQQQGDMRETALRNQGLVPGGEAYTNAMRDFNFAKNDAYSGARNMAYGQGLAAQNQEFGQGMQNAGLNNATSGQAIQQQAYMRGLPLNEFNALRTGAQVSTPQFGPTPGGPNYSAAAGAQGQYDQGLFNAQQGAANSFNSGLMGMLGTAGGAYAGSAGGSAALAALFASDRRLKSNIVRIGTHPLGIGVYEYDIFGERQRGVMADEVLTVLPEAVVQRPDGYLMVDYGQL